MASWAVVEQRFIASRHTVSPLGTSSGFVDSCELFVTPEVSCAMAAKLGSPVLQSRKFGVNKNVQLLYSFDNIVKL